MFRKRPGITRGNGDEENPFLLSFSDLMASLLAIFILALVVMMIQLHLKKKELEEERLKVKLSLIELRDSLNEIQETQNEVVKALDGVGSREKSLEGMLEGIQKDLKERGIEVIVTENGTVIRIPERALTFATNKHEIQEEYRETVDQIGAALLKALRQDSNRKLLDTVFVEGHTDSVPNRRDMGNWGLSTYRAISLWLHWTEAPGNFPELKELKSLPKEDGRPARPLISTSGYADTRPTDPIVPAPAPALDAPGNAADRRIDIRFTLASSEKKDLSGLKEKLQKMSAKTNELIDKLEGLE
jgi:flagellar motor protein MotB